METFFLTKQKMDVQENEVIKLDFYCMQITLKGAKGNMVIIATLSFKEVQPFFLASMHNHIPHGKLLKHSEIDSGPQ